MTNEFYENPLISRYSSPEMSRIWGAQRKFETWRQLWIALAEAEQELGLDISPQQIQQLRDQATNIDFDLAKSYEKKLRHDVMAHVHTYGDACPDARKIIHLGATSCFVTDNTDLILIRDAMHHVRSQLIHVIVALGKFALEHRAMPCLAYTHFQPAQPTTVGKRVILWAQDLYLDLQEVEHRIDSMRARSVKGTTGTQASFLELFDGDHEKVLRLEKLVAQKIGFDDTYHVGGQTYPRKIDSQILDVLSGIAQSCHKMASDLRLLAHLMEMEEPFEKHQIGSSAMAYKRNPMRAERMCALSRFVISLQSSPAQTMATQWMERTLDDSANRRLVIPQAFLAIDAVLMLYQNVASGFVVYPKVIENHLQEKLPFMATENIMMAATAAGGDRQELHEKIRQHSQSAASSIKLEGQPNDLIQRLKSDRSFNCVDIENVLKTSQFTGRSEQQVQEFYDQIIAPLESKIGELPISADIRV